MSMYVRAVERGGEGEERERRMGERMSVRGSEYQCEQKWERE